MAIAMNDLTEKANNIKHNTINLCNQLQLFHEHDEEYLYLMKFIELEIKLGIHRCASSNTNQETQ